MSETSPAAGHLPTGNLYLHLYGELPLADRQVTAAHLAECETCRATLAELEATRAATDALPAFDVSDQRWTRMVSVAACRRRARPHPERTFAAHRGAFAAAAAALVAIGATGAWALGAGRRSEIDALRAELTEMRAVAALALLRDPGGAARLRGVGVGAALLASDGRVSVAFVRALRDDPSPNVRLAVLDAIDASPRQAPLVDALAVALAEEPLPAIRLAIIDLLARLADRRARTGLAAIATSDPDSTVRRRAGAAIIEVDREAGGARR
jgi:hypothetical protein